MTATPLATEAARAVATPRSRRKVVERSSRRSNLLTVIVWVSVVYFLTPLVWLAI